MPAPAEAICQEIVWKSPELRRFCVALIKAALAQTDADFTTDIVGDDVRSRYVDQPGPGMAGSAVTLLKNASLIKPVGITQGGVFYAHRRISERPGAKSRWLNIYQLTSRPLASEFLARNDSSSSSSAPSPAVQVEFEIVGRVPSPGVPVS